MDVSIIIVNYNTKNLLHDCLQSIVAHTKDILYEIIVADNNSTDGSREMIRGKYPETLLLCNKENIGFSCANNIAYRHSKGKYLLFLNSDTLILNNSIKTMMDYMKLHPKVAIVGPKILDSNHQPTRSYMRTLDLRKLFLGSKYFKPFIDVEKHRIHFPEYNYDAIQQVPWLSGACLMIKRSVFQEVGLFDEHYFLYLEDMDLCLQTEKMGYRNIYLPAAEIIHFFGGSSSNNGEILRKVREKSMAYYFKKNFSVTHYLIAKLYIIISANLNK